MITMNPGSNYPGYFETGLEPHVVRRMIEMPRTESMEVQPSSASAPEDYERIESDDDSVSLVDSLDDPISKSNTKRGETDESAVLTERSPRPQYEKSQAFFVPIADQGQKPLGDVDSGRLDTALAQAMPDSLRERLEKRQTEMSLRRQDDDWEKPINVNRRKNGGKHRRQKKTTVVNRIEGQQKPIKSSSTSAVESTTTSSGSLPPMALKKNGRFLRAEIGLLESYTIDAQGNLQFKEPQSVPSTKRSVGHVKKSIIHHTVMKKVSSHKSSPKRIDLTKSGPSKRSAPKLLPEHKKSNARGQVSTMKKQPLIAKDLQQMTLYHQSHSDIITPDMDCGPRRMYQKTEIHDGEKRIEILEIVECLNSSSDETTNSTGTPISFTPSMPLKYSKLSKSSKIPVPVVTAATNSASTRGRTKEPTSQKSSSRNASSRESSQTSGAGHFVKNLHQMGSNTKVDQIIADLLIEALNHSTEFGIEFVTSPLDNNNQANGVSSKRAKVTRRNGINSSGKRSACSGKYQQVFDAIPEERGSLSVDSSNDERVTAKLSQLVNTPSVISTAQTTAISTAISTDTIDTMASTAPVSTAQTTSSSSAALPTGSSEASQRKMTIRRPDEEVNRKAAVVPRGREAIENVEDKSDAWFDCFGRSHIGSPADNGSLVDEGIVRHLNKTRLFA